MALGSAVSGSHGSLLAADTFRPVPQTGSGQLSAAQPAATAMVATAGPAAAGELRPVPKFGGTSLRDPQRTAQQPATAHHLQWRTSSQVAPPAVSAVAAATPAAASSGAVRQAQFDLPQPTPSPQLSQPTQPQQTPDMGLQLPPALEAPPTSDRALPDFFADPFGERNDAPPSIPDASATDTPSSPMVLPPAQTPPLQNGLRQPAEPGQTSPSDRPAQPGAESADEPLELRPTPGPGIEDVRRPRQLEDFELPGRSQDRDRRAPVAPEEDTTLIRPVAFSCDDFRQSIADAKIQKLSLDISPPFRPDVIEMDEFRRLKNRFEERQESRDWQSVDGRKLGRGRMRDLAYEKVVIETEFGTLEELPVNRLSEADLAYVSSQWGLPQECLIEQPQYQARTWTASKITWKASNLMHKPLYFEEVNLERYGHTAGPFLQPVVSSAHFFANIAVLPYKMGVHSPNECQYALGYYRPGNCAPWITPPVPLSLRGALYQAGAMTGVGLLVP